mmetsp:Transcript_87490/g.127937  ORF Transcript_87490/g.127937 Transcript_87490/m.127937 type:complete len:216 (-) Transcript_87490:78-725(-)
MCCETGFWRISSSGAQRFLAGDACLVPSGGSGRCGSSFLARVSSSSAAAASAKKVARTCSSVSITFCSLALSRIKCPSLSSTSFTRALSRTAASFLPVFSARSSSSFSNLSASCILAVRSFERGVRVPSRSSILSSGRLSLSRCRSRAVSLSFSTSDKAGSDAAALFCKCSRNKRCRMHSSASMADSSLLNTCASSFSCSCSEIVSAMLSPTDNL